MKLLSDEDLMVAYTEGDSAAFDALFERYAKLIFRVLRRKVRREEDAAELVQQTFLQMHRARAQFEPGRKLRPWLMTIAFNLNRQLFRGRIRRPEEQLDFEPVHDKAIDSLERASDARRIRRAVATLPKGQRDVIVMHWFEDRTFAEVAQTLGLSTSAVKVRAHRGYKALRQVLQANDEIPSSRRAA